MDLRRPAILRNSSASNTGSRRAQHPERRQRSNPRPSSVISGSSEWPMSRGSNDTLPGPSGSYPISSSDRSQSPFQSRMADQPSSTAPRNTNERRAPNDDLSFNVDSSEEDEERDHDADASPANSQELPPAPPRPRTIEPTENVEVKRKLNTWDAAALIMNKMIGGGIFTTPGQILLLTGNKGIALSFWVIGGVYSMISFSLYLEYGLNFPFNGGDLIYLDETWPFPELLSTTIYSGFFITLGHNAGNAVVFAKYCIAASLQSSNSTTDLKTTDFDKRVINLIAVFALSVVCLLLWVSDRTGLALNRLLAYYKCGLLLTVFIAGGIALNYPNSGCDDWTYMAPLPSSTSNSSFSRLSAMIYIIYAYQGWENANYVTGELKLAAHETDYPKHVLRLGGFIAVGTTTFLYVVAVAGYYMACSFETITSGNSDMGMGQYFASQVFGGHTVGFKICIALSALGNLIAVVYSNSKVKQCIAQQRIFPLSDWFMRDDRFGTPGPALFLHWLFTTAFIVAMPNSTDGYTFIIGLYSYSHLIVLVFVGLGIFRLCGRMRGGTGKKKGDEIEMEAGDRGTAIPRRWEWKFLVKRELRWFATVLFVGVNALVVGVSVKPPNDGKNGTIHRYLWPIISFSVFGLAALYWLFLRSMMTKMGARFWGMQMSVYVGSEARRKREKPQGEVESTDFDRMLNETRRNHDNRYVSWQVKRGLYGTVWRKIKGFAKLMRQLVSSD